MCKEDLGLGRGRVALAPVVVTVTGTQALQADSRRVAVLLSMVGLSVFDSAAAANIQDVIHFVFNDSPAGTVNVVMVGINSPLLLRIEDCGDLITKPLFVNIFSSTGTAAAVITPIITNVNVEPITR